MSSTAAPSTTGSETAAGRTGGMLAAVGAFVLWGVFPIYWKRLYDVDAIEVIAHRVVWSLGFLLVVLQFRGTFGQYMSALRSPRLIGLYLASGILLSVNWLTYVWAVMSSQIVEASLGYFLNPLFNVLLGFAFLRERLRPVQWAAIALAGAGVAVQLVKVGRVPWIALVLAVSFAFYGLLRKRGPLGPLTGLGVETTLLAPAALVLLVARGLAGTGALGRVDFEQHVLILATGVVTAIPLLLFAIGARALPLTTLGLLQYMSPTVQLGLGVLVYHEVFDATLATSFGLIWAGLAVYSADGVMRRRFAFRSAGDEPHPKAR